MPPRDLQSSRRQHRILTRVADGRAPRSCAPAQERKGAAALRVLWVRRSGQTRDAERVAIEVVSCRRDLENDVAAAVEDAVADVSARTAVGGDGLLAGGGAGSWADQWENDRKRNDGCEPHSPQGRGSGHVCQSEIDREAVTPALEHRSVARVDDAEVDVELPPRRGSTEIAGQILPAGALDVGRDRPRRGPSAERHPVALDAWTTTVERRVDRTQGAGRRCSAPDRGPRCRGRGSSRRRSADGT
jgi:hypothetical protein